MLCVFQVHSLTARSVSREFREGLRLSHPSPPNTNIKVTPKTKTPLSKALPTQSKIEEQLRECDTETFNNTCVSDPNFVDPTVIEKTPNNANNDVLTSTALNKAKRATSNSILSRAAFWDKRVQEEIVDDNVAIKQFPKIEGIATDS